MNKNLLPNGMKAVYVRWVDASTRRGWEPADCCEPVLIHSVGIEVARSEKAIVLSTSFNSGTYYADQMVIPMSAVQKITRLL